MKSERSREILPIAIYIALAVVVGLIVLGDYGESWDEANIVKYAAHSLENYRLLFQGEPAVNFQSGHLDHYGPAFFVGVMAFSNVAQKLVSGSTLVESWHLAYFITFEISVLFMYLLARRFFGQWASFGTAVLYGSQPLLWGHAFINPKDIPFLALFLIALVLGLRMVDRDLAFLSTTDLAEGQPGAKAVGWKHLQPLTKSSIVGACIFVLVISVLLLTHAFDGVVDLMVTYFYNASPESFLGRIFSRAASQSSQLPVDRYIVKAQILAGRFAGLAGLAVLFYAVWIIIRNLTPLRNLQRSEILGLVWKTFKMPAVLAAGIALGLTVSTRVLGPYAFVIVAFYAVFLLKEKAAIFLTPYFIVAALITYATWPYLWGDPVFRYLDSLLKMADFPWSGELLFSGQLYSSTALPWNYLPKLLSLQLTEPVVLSFIPGLFLAAFWMVRKKERVLLPLILIWFVLPVSAIILKRSTLYDNFRHILFLLPPVFLTSGAVLEESYRHLRKFSWRSVALILILLPSLQALTTLHPYQYTYYNRFVGGMRGAFRKYEMDYWLTSFNEMALYLNKNARPGARVLVFGPANLLDGMLREDIIPFETSLDPNGEPPDYAVVPARKNDDLLGCRKAPITYAVERGGAILGVIKTPEAPGQCP